MHILKPWERLEMNCIFQWHKITLLGFKFKNTYSFFYISTIKINSTAFCLIIHFICNTKRIGIKEKQKSISSISLSKKKCKCCIRSYSIVIDRFTVKTRTFQLTHACETFATYVRYSMKR